MSAKPHMIQLFQEVITNLVQTGNGIEWRGRCPFPACIKKRDPKFYVNAETGLFLCHRCGMEGNSISFAKYFGERPEPYYDLAPNPRSIDHREIDQYHQDLLKRPKQWPKPWKHHILKLLQVGWDDLRHCLVFPIYSSSGQIINLIHHKTFQNKGARCMLYPAHILKDYDPGYIVLCEGLTDCLSLMSIDIQVVTTTAGALSIPEDISALRRFKKIYLCFDVDEAGEAGCDRWINRLLSEMER